jgi:L-ascorbate metabolism protein UlaG (beta-lactamase superfamily)
VSTARQQLDTSASERDFQGFVVSYAGWQGWKRIYHTYDSRRSPEGFPDLVMVRPPRLVIAECKTEKGKVTAAQQAWLDDLLATQVHLDSFAFPTPEVYLWRPSDTDKIMELLK